jgi:hypothetical protein
LQCCESMQPLRVILDGIPARLPAEAVVRTFLSRNFLTAALSCLSICSSICAAAPDEIQVYLDDMSEPGHFGVDVHNNYVLSGSRTPDYPGAQSPYGVYRLTPEIYYGLSHSYELGLYVLSSLNPQGQTNIDGAKLRMKYIAPHDAEKGSFWGVNFELGRVDRRFSENPWTTELKGIYGYRGGSWLFAINPNLDWSFSGQANSPVALRIDSKLAYQAGSNYAVGIEMYNDMGPLHNLGHLSQESEMLYGVVDVEVKNWEVNFGVGRGLTTASDRWVLKLIVGTRY